MSKPQNWGRIWRVTIQAFHPYGMSLPETFVEPGDIEVLTFESKDWEPEGLRIKFDAELTVFQGFWCADVVLYNLNAPTSQAMISYGMTCTVEAGYQSTGLATVYKGTVFQPMWEKEHGTDWKLTLRCVVGIIEVSNNLINHTVAAGVSQRQLVSEMLTHAKYPIQLFGADFENPYPVTRATTYFGHPSDFLQNLADSNDCQLWFSHLAANIYQLRESTTVPEWEYGIDNGLVGTPQQTEKGVVMRVLLNPKIQLLHQVKLNRNVAIKQLQRSVGNPVGFASIITQDYRYTVCALHHYGDSRGNDWYTDITAIFSPDKLINQF